MNALPDQRWPEPTYMRTPEPTPEQIAERKAEVLAAWRDDESRFAETVADVICEVSQATQAEMASLAHCGDSAAFGDLVLALWRAKWQADAQQRAEDELAGLV
jgi:hypothetical protein